MIFNYTADGDIRKLTVVSDHYIGFDDDSIIGRKPKGLDPSIKYFAREDQAFISPFNQQQRIDEEDVFMVVKQDHPNLFWVFAENTYPMERFTYEVRTVLSLSVLNKLKGGMEFFTNAKGMGCNVSCNYGDCSLQYISARKGYIFQSSMANGKEIGYTGESSHSLREAFTAAFN